MKALDETDAGDLESAMLHACNAIDGVARKKWPGMGNAARFKRLLTENLTVLECIGMPGIDLESTRFVLPLRVGGSPTVCGIEDVLYHVHRCTQGHGDELPGGFEIVVPASGKSTSLHVQVGQSTTLPVGVIHALVMIAVLETESVPSEIVPERYFLWYQFTGNPVTKIHRSVHEWWGKRDEFYREEAKYNRMRVSLDFATNYSAPATPRST